MNAREQAANRDLRALDDAHRLGQVTRAQYRERRRRLLATLQRGSSVVTARHALGSHDQTTERNATIAKDPPWPSSARPLLGWRQVGGLVVSLLLIVLLLYLFVRMM